MYWKASCRDHPYSTIYVQKVGHFTIRDFSWNFFKLEFIYKKYDILRYVTFLYTKSQTLRKKHDNLRYVFIYSYPDTVALSDFSLNFWNWPREGGHIKICKKQCTLRHIFISKKRCTLRYVFISKIHRIVNKFELFIENSSYSYDK